jgi:hypothetical protein
VIQALRNKDLPVAESQYEAVGLTMSTCTFFPQIIKFSPLSWFPMYFFDWRIYMLAPLRSKRLVLQGWPERRYLIPDIPASALKMVKGYTFIKRNEKDPISLF